MLARVQTVRGKTAIAFNHAQQHHHSTILRQIPYIAAIMDTGAVPQVEIQHLAATIPMWTSLPRAWISLL